MCHLDSLEKKKITRDEKHQQQQQQQQKKEDGQWSKYLDDEAASTQPSKRTNGWSIERNKNNHDYDDDYDDDNDIK